MAESPGARRPTLRVGVLLDGSAQPAWARKVLADIEASGFARLEVVAVHRGARERPRRRWLKDLYLRVDRKLFRANPDAFAVAEVGRPVVEAKGGDDLATHDLDVLIAVGSGLPLAAYAAAARHGVWSLRHGTQEGLREVLGGQPATASVLEAWSPGAAPRTIHRSFGSTDHVSVRRNLNPLCWKGAAFVLRALRDLAADGALAPLPPEAPPPPRAEGNLATAGLLLRHSARYVTKKLKDLVANDQWYLAYRFEDEPREGFDGLVEIMPGSDRYWADPFPVRTDEGRFFLFFEELRYSHPKGTLHALEVDPLKGAGKPFPVLERPYHLSYPQVFRFDGRYYMLPETEANGTVTLFRCESFPDKWVEERDLLKGVDAVDATVAEVDDRWWMFVNIAPFGADNKDELHLYEAPSPLGPWIPHPRNPVKSDCRSARPAGALFRRSGQLYRPAQDCAGSYGAAIVIHRVDELSPEAYRETPVARIVPTWDRKALQAHTINRCEGMLVLDLLRRRRRFL